MLDISFIDISNILDKSHARYLLYLQALILEISLVRDSARAG